MDVGKDVPNHYKSEFALSILISLFIVLELNMKIFFIVLQKVFEKTNSPPFLVKLLSHIQLSYSIYYQRDCLVTLVILRGGSTSCPMGALAPTQFF